jgi:hypothetical protein
MKRYRISDGVTFHGSRSPTCVGKVRHRTVQEAEWHRVAVTAKHRKDFDVYLCASCGDFHIGTSRQEP